MSVEKIEVATTALRIIDMDRAVDFWTEGCALEVVTTISNDRFDSTILKGPQGGSAIQLIKRHGDNEPVVHGDGFTKIVLSCSNIELRMANAQAQGGKIVQPAREMAYLQGLIIGSVACPDGYLVEFVQQP